MTIANGVNQSHGGHGDPTEVKLDIPSGESENDGIGLNADNLVHKIFVELDELDVQEEEWVERSRWIKYEQNIEQSANRWGKPHVSTLSFNAILELKKCLEFGSVLLDLEEEVLPGMAGKIVERMKEDNQVDDYTKGIIKWSLQLKHRYWRPGSILNTIATNKRKSARPDIKKKEPLRKISTYPMVEKGHLNPSFIQDGLQSVNDINSNKERKISVTARSRKISVEQKKTIMQPPEDKKQKAQRHWALIRDNLHKISGRGEQMDFTHLVKNIMELDKAEEFMKCIPEGSQTASILVGKADFVDHPVSAFVRLSEARNMGLMLAEVPLDVRFIFLYLVPVLHTENHIEIGRTMATLLSNPGFHPIAYEATSRGDIIDGLDCFMNKSLVIPTSQSYDEDTLLPALNSIIKKEKAEQKEKKSEIKATIEAKANVSSQVETSAEFDPDIVMAGEKSTCKLSLFKGLINDIKTRYPKYASDIKDGFNKQCIMATLFMYFASLGPAITFGALLDEKTHKNIGISESILISGIAGVIMSVIAGQPLMVVGLTGPVYLFEQALYQLTDTLDIDYLSFHFWVCIWIAIISTIVVAFNGSGLARYCTRFTQEMFAMFVSVILIFETFRMLYFTFKDHPLKKYYAYADGLATTLLPTLTSEKSANKSMEYHNENLYDNLTAQPNTALLSLLLCFGTYLLSTLMISFRNGDFMSNSLRRLIGAFSTSLTILIMVLLDLALSGTYVETLDVENGFTPTNQDQRGWIINPMGNYKDLPLWAPFAACLPALMAFILIYLETQMTGHIISKNMVKGNGQNLNLNIIGITHIFSGILGLPVFSGAYVRSMMHVVALCVYKTTYAPGERPKLENVIEQRITAFVYSLLLGCSVLLGPVLRQIPISVLVGVFFGFGMGMLGGISIWARFKLFFVSPKHHPDIGYVSKVKTKKMHLFTAIQMIILAAALVVKFTPGAIAFPLLLSLCIPFRQKVLPLIFTDKEIQQLDKADDDTD